MWGKTSTLAMHKQIDYIIFTAPDGARIGKIIGWQENDRLIVLSIPLEGGDERLFFVDSKNYSKYHYGLAFNCDATIIPVKFDGEYTEDGDIWEGKVEFYLLPQRFSNWWLAVPAVFFMYQYVK